jgi:uncharacterized protein
MVAILIMAKAPLPGQVKTRLCPPLTPAQACACHEAFLLDTLALVRNSGTARYLAYSGSQEWFVEHCPDFQCFAQQGADLAERLDCALQTVLCDHQPVLCIGSDSPQLPLSLLKMATTWLEDHDVVFGPTQDGGYYLVGMNQFHDLFLGMPMSTHRLLASTLNRCWEQQLKVGLLPVLRDLDTWNDVETQRSILQTGYTGDLLQQLSV